MSDGEVKFKLFHHIRTGHRYVFVRETASKFYTKGDVLMVAGCSARHGRDRTWLRTMGVLEDRVLSEELLRELLSQGET